MEGAYRLLVRQVQVAGGPASVELGGNAVDEGALARRVGAGGALGEGAAALGQRLQVRKQQLRHRASARKTASIEMLT